MYVRVVHSASSSSPSSSVIFVCRSFVRRTCVYRRSRVCIKWSIYFLRTAIRYVFRFAFPITFCVANTNTQKTARPKESTQHIWWTFRDHHGPYVRASVCVCIGSNVLSKYRHTVSLYTSAPMSVCVCVCTRYTHSPNRWCSNDAQSRKLYVYCVNTRSVALFASKQTDRIKICSARNRWRFTLLRVVCTIYNIFFFLLPLLTTTAASVYLSFFSIHFNNCVLQQLIIDFFSSSSVILVIDFFSCTFIFFFQFLCICCVFWGNRISTFGIWIPFSRPEKKRNKINSNLAHEWIVNWKFYAPRWQ